jgi:cell shape-determining protein MreC
MKKTFLARRNALFSSTDVSWGAYALALSVFLLLVRLLAPNLFWHMFTPVFESATFVTNESHAFFASFGNTAELALQNEALADENTALMNENQTLSQKAADLEALLSAPAGGKVGEVLAGVVARPPESPYDTLVLNAGERAGVSTGMEVFGTGGVPIGVVSSVTADFARVTLFSSPGMSIHGFVGSANVPLTINGSGAGTMNATISRSAGISVGDNVSVPGPGVLTMGKIVRVDSDPSLPSVTLRIMPILNLFSLSWVVLRTTGAVFSNALSPATSTPL